MKKEAFKKLSMPEQSKDPMLDEGDLLEEDASYDDMGMEEGMGALDDIDDEDLIAEMKKRGLTLDEEESEEGEEDYADDMSEEDFEGEYV